jgi:ATP-dependent Clp protease ATP-binding subunit ClpA
LNRIDKVIVYRPLEFDQLKKITALQIGYLQDRLSHQGITLKATAAVVKHIADQSFDPAQGARFIRRNVQNLLEDPLAELIIGKGVTPGSMISADIKKDAIAFQLTLAKEKLLTPA